MKCWEFNCIECGLFSIVYGGDRPEKCLACDPPKVEVKPVNTLALYGIRLLEGIDVDNVTLVTHEELRDSNRKFFAEFENRSALFMDVEKVLLGQGLGGDVLVETKEVLDALGVEEAVMKEPTAHQARVFDEGFRLGWDTFTGAKHGAEYAAQYQQQPAPAEPICRCSHYASSHYLVPKVVGPGFRSARCKGAESEECDCHKFIDRNLPADVL